MTEFRMRTKPQPPVRKKLSSRIRLNCGWDGKTLFDLIEAANKVGADPAQCVFTIEDRDYEDTVGCVLTLNYDESAEDFQKRQETYEKNLVDYTEWCVKNAKNIAIREHEMAQANHLRAANARAAMLKNRKKDVVRLETELLLVKAEIAKLKGES